MIETGKVTVECPQLPIMGGYAFTDYSLQGQTLIPVLLDLPCPQCDWQGLMLRSAEDPHSCPHCRFRQRVPVGILFMAY